MVINIIYYISIKLYFDVENTLLLPSSISKSRLITVHDTVLDNTDYSNHTKC